MDAFWPLVAQQSEAHLNRLRELQKSEIGLVSGQGQTVDVQFCQGTGETTFKCGEELSDPCNIDFSFMIDCP